MKVCRIQFKKNGKKYYFNPGSLNVSPDMFVVVETVRGVEIGKVSGDLVDCPVEIEAEIKPVLRIATKKDVDNHKYNLSLEPAVLEKCAKLIKKNELEMKLLRCEYTLDRQKLIIYFESEARVDFRQLVKDLAEEFKVRIELRQIGSRDGAKALGGLGPCGLIVCCNTFIEEFDNVSIKMAKNQNLSLNPQKISGTCGKLLCCIKYENDLYTEMRANLPDVNDTVTLEEGDGKVLSVDVIKRELKVKMFTDEKFVTVKAEDIKSYRSRKAPRENVDRELKGLE